MVALNPGFQPMPYLNDTLQIGTRGNNEGLSITVSPIFSLIVHSFIHTTTLSTQPALTCSQGGTSLTRVNNCTSQIGRRRATMNDSSYINLSSNIFPQPCTIFTQYTSPHSATLVL